MALRNKAGRISALLSLGAGAVLLLFVFAKAMPVSKPDPDRSEPPDPTEMIQATEIPFEPVAVSSVALPPPPMPEAPAAPPPPEPEPEPAVTVEPLKPSEPVAEPEPALKVEPLRPQKPNAKAKAEIEVEPLKPTEPKGKTVEKVLEIKPLKKALREKAEIVPRTPEAKPEPVVNAEPKPEYRVKPIQPKPEPRREIVKKTEPAHEPAPESEPETVRVSVQTRGQIVKDGRALLRLLEHGSGPTIEIAWPRGQGARQQLYRSLTRCYGMQAILMDGHGNLFRQSGERGRKWEINLDRYSGFVRQPAGFVAGAERRITDDIRRYHGLGYGTRLVRIFPRQVDAVLLGGLQKLLGGRYKKAGLIRASYRQAGGNLYVDEIETDGIPVDGQIALAGRRGCRT
ncbi:MAG: hypothetical protein MI741_20235 [Rhodospirillales bacterium]|nr:hypothetical protein [Rhodospirillales bacterium]